MGVSRMKTFNYYNLETEILPDYNIEAIKNCFNPKIGKLDNRKLRHLHFDKCGVDGCDDNAQLMCEYDIQVYYDCYACNNDLCESHMKCGITNKDYHKYFSNDIANRFEHYDKDLDLDIVLVCEDCYMIANDCKNINQGGK